MHEQHDNHVPLFCQALNRLHHELDAIGQILSGIFAFAEVVDVAEVVDHHEFAVVLGNALDDALLNPVDRHPGREFLG